ncbi:acyl-CoA dehydrogenase family protein [Bradyrhizobium arachidis]|uniref:acyl-CoA dehydrogenase family protein n=1 Tax=Bradyrhizobium arachidis TaxID=858423 RepID=UPI002161B8D9|nr:acyl-CoA dehydrogenase family protein [Bradyrhizobium arachidis]
MIGLGAVWEGVARGALNAAVRHATGSVRKDRNESLADYQAIRQELGAAKVLVKTLRPWRNELASRLDELWRAGMGGGDQGETLATIRMRLRRWGRTEGRA